MEIDIIKRLLKDNERVRNLYEIGPVQRCSVEDFADAIINECISELTNNLFFHGIDHSNDPEFYKAIEKTKKYFNMV